MGIAVGDEVATAQCHRLIEVKARLRRLQDCRLVDYRRRRAEGSLCSRLDRRWVKFQHSDDRRVGLKGT